MSEPKTQRDNVALTHRDFNSAAILLAEAFYDNPSHQYIFGDPTTRLEFLEWGLKANLKLNLATPHSLSHSFALIETDKVLRARQVKAMGFWHPPKVSQIDSIAKITSGFFLAPIKFGRATYERLSEVMTAMEAVKAEVLGRDKAWYLNNMAVAKELRGMGIGTQLLTRQLQAKIVPSRCPAILMTQKPENVRFYEQLGFKIACRSLIGRDANAFTNWCLLFEQSEQSI